MRQRTVAVVGGGIAGLAAAWELVGGAGVREPEVRVIVFEGGDRVGGKLRTRSFAGGPVDLGPDAFVARRPEAVALCHELGLDDDLVSPGARRAYVWARGRLRLLPAGLALGVPTRLGPLLRSGICSPAGLVRPAWDLVRPAGGRGATPPPPTATEADRAVGQITTSRLGREVTTRLAGPLIGGIHAGSVDTMSAAAVFPALLEADARPGSLMRALRTVTAGVAAGGGDNETAPVFLSVRGGMGRLADELAQALEQRGVELRRASAVCGLDRVTRTGGRWRIRTDGADVEVAHTDVDAVVMAVPSATAAGLLRPHDPELAGTLAEVTYSSVSTVTMRFSPAVIDHRLDASGFLVPRDEGRADPLLTACTWLTSKWPELDAGGDVLVRASVGRDGDVRHESLDDDELVRRCVAELGAMMGVHGSPVDTMVTRWPEAFPQYRVGHPARVAAIEAAAARLPSLALAGAALHGVGIPACIGSGRRAARAVLAPVTGAT